MSCLRDLLLAKGKTHDWIDRFLQVCRKFEHIHDLWITANNALIFFVRQKEEPEKFEDLKAEESARKSIVDAAWEKSEMVEYSKTADVGDAFHDKCNDKIIISWYSVYCIWQAAQCLLRSGRDLGHAQKLLEHLGIV